MTTKTHKPADQKTATTREIEARVAAFTAGDEGVSWREVKKKLGLSS